MSHKVTREKEITIKMSFGLLDNPKVFCNLLNRCQDYLYGNKVIKIDEYLLKTLAHQKSEKRYQSFQIKKKSGGDRTIHAPKPELKVVLSCLNLIFQCIYSPHTAAYGFVENKSVADNAKLHCRNNYVFNLDLKDFFPSIEIGRILNRLSYPPFNLNKENGREQIGNYIAWLACHEMEVERMIDGEIQKVIKRVLPQGSPLSPILTNIICEKLDKQLTGVANRFGVKYSRYADDITFSSMHNVYQENSEFRSEVLRIINSQYFLINESKVRLQKQNVRQEVTGITVNKDVNVSKSYVKRLRLWLSMWEKYGIDKAYELFLNGYKKDKGYTKKIGQTPAFMENVIAGKLNYLKMIKGEENSTYIQLKTRYEKLSTRSISIDELLDTWETEGIDVAKNQYYNFKYRNYTDNVIFTL